MPAVIKIRPLNDDRAAVFSPFEAKDDVKALMGARWDPDLRAWTIPLVWAEHAAEELRFAGWEVRLDPWLNPPQPPKPQATTVARPWAEQLFAAIPANLRTPAYRALAKVLHPDAGGDTTTMQALTAAYNQIGA